MRFGSGTKQSTNMAFPIPQPLSFAAPELQTVPLSSSSGNGVSPLPRSLTLSSSLSGRDIWRNPNLRSAPQPTIANGTMPNLLSALSQTYSADELHSVMSSFLCPRSGSRSPPFSSRFMISLLSRVPDYRRSLALLDWMLDSAHFPPLAAAYNIVLRNAARASDFPLAFALLHEMRSPPRSLSPDRFTYSILISSLSRSNLLDAALSLLPIMESDSISPDLVLYTTLISLSLRLNNPSKALALYSRLRSSGLSPDLIAYNTLLSALSRSGLLQHARRILLSDMDAASVPPDTISFSTVLSSLSSRRRFSEAISLFSEMLRRRLPLDPPVCNIALHAYGSLGMPREAASLFWSMRHLGVTPSLVTYNTMLRIYGESGLFSDAIHLFRLMQKHDIFPNVVTYNTMICNYGRSLEHQKAGNVFAEMQSRGVKPDAITYSTIISIWARAGKLFDAAKLFQKIRESGQDVHPTLYQTMIVVYERAGLVAHARRLSNDLKENQVSKDEAVTILAGADRLEEATWLFRHAEVKDVRSFRCMMELFSRNRKHRNVVQVFDRMRAVSAGKLPDSDMVYMALSAYGKLQQYEKAEALYNEMEEEGCLFEDKVHFHMLELLGMTRNFKRVEELVEKLSACEEVVKKELYLAAANVYQRANRLEDASRIVGWIRKMTAASDALQVQ